MEGHYNQVVSVENNADAPISYVEHREVQVEQVTTDGSALPHALARRERC